VSSLKVDNITGRGSTGFTGSVKSEGGNTTTDLQQGLGKSWVTHSSASIQDSLNVSSITDIEGGTQQIFFSNSMANTTYVISGFAGNNSDSVSNTITAQRPYLWATASYKIRTLYNSGVGVATDYDHTDNMVLGDLA